MREFSGSALALGLVLALAAPVTAARSDYVGSDACGSCHEAAFTTWKAGPHARAGELLGEARGQRQCLGCHTTGEAPAGRPFFDGVGCEACHGPGAGYAPADVMANPLLARELGLRDLSTPERRAAVCGSCHRADTGLRRFDPEAAWPTIQHGM
jgi:hypothetical protein